MKRIIATFGGHAYDERTQRTYEYCNFYAHGGPYELMVFDDRWLIDSCYVDVNRWLFDAWSPANVDNPTMVQHGFGWCSWKAFVIMSAFDRCERGDVVLYMDGDCYPVGRLDPLFERCDAEGGVLLFDENCSSLRFTKGDCFRAMGMPIQESPHACGRFSLWQKGPFLPRQMLAEWWAYSINPRCTLWDRSILGPDQPEYFRNSTEQSVLSNLAAKYRIPLHRAPDQGGWPNPERRDDWYDQLFVQEFVEADKSDKSGSRFRNV